MPIDRLTEPLSPFSVISDILRRVEVQIAASKRRYSVPELLAMARSAPPLRSFSGALKGQFSLIAEIKRKSPSKGFMRHRDIKEIASIYSQARCVRAVSVLTNMADFGMDLGALTQVKEIVHQPILRKDFIIDPHQVYEARAFGADAILLMASILTKSGLRVLSNLAHDLGLEVLFEAHTKAEIDKFPKTAHICGINSRAFVAKAYSYQASRFISRLGWRTRDLSTDLRKFHLSEYFRKRCIRVAESGISPCSVSTVRDRYKFDAILVGTSILMARDLREALQEFEDAIEKPIWANQPQMCLGPSFPILSQVR